MIYGYIMVHKMDAITEERFIIFGMFYISQTDSDNEVRIPIHQFLGVSIDSEKHSLFPFVISSTLTDGHLFDTEKEAEDVIHRVCKLRPQYGAIKFRVIKLKDYISNAQIFLSKLIDGIDIDKEAICNSYHLMNS